MVYPAAYMPIYAKAAEAKLAIINMVETPCDDQADLIIAGQAGVIMEQVMREIRKTKGD